MKAGSGMLSDYGGRQSKGETGLRYRVMHILGDRSMQSGGRQLCKPGHGRVVTRHSLTVIFTFFSLYVKPPEAAKSESETQTL